MMMIVDQQHLVESLRAAETALEILLELPDSDLCSELKNIVGGQSEIILCMLQGKHFGSDRLEDFEGYLKAINHQMEHL